MFDEFYDYQVSNLELIAACWGKSTADHVLHCIEERLHSQGVSIEFSAQGNEFKILEPDAGAHPIDRDSLADLPYKLTAEPIYLDAAGDPSAMQVHAVISWRGDNLPRYCAPRDVQLDHHERWFAVYKSDMQIVGHTFRCIREGRMTPHWQPVCDYRNSSHVLYHEGLVRFGAQSEALSPAVIFPALERTGMVSTFDWLMVQHVLNELRRHPSSTLAVNISVKSAHLHGWWPGVLAELEEQPDVARRLVVEITETEPLVRVEAAVTFAHRLRAVGGMLALDDFGAGFTSIRELMDLVPALVKVDGSFVKRAASQNGPCYSLPHMIRLIHELGGTVIVEGVENQAMAEIGYISGAIWQQGYYHGRPDLIRTGTTYPVHLSIMMARSTALVEQPVVNLNKELH